LDADGIDVDVQHASRLAGRGADAAGELREVVGAVQYLDGADPVLPVHQVVEVRDDVVDRAAVVAERRAAVHAARALDLRLLLVEADDELLVVLHALGDGLVALLDALVFHEAGDLSHRAFLCFLGVQTAASAGRVACGSRPTCALLPLLVSSTRRSWISARARLYSLGKTFTNRVRASAQSSSSSRARLLPVQRWCD